MSNMIMPIRRARLGPLAALAALSAAAFVSALSTAQDLGVKAPPQSQDVILRGATIHPVSGPVIARGYVAFADGRITFIGEAPPPTTAGRSPMTIDAVGKHIYPGLIAANTIIGLTEVGAARATQDSNEVGEITPEVRAAVAVNPDSTIIPVTRSSGILTAAVMPEGGSLPGRLSVMRMDGWTWEDLAVEDDAGLVIDWPFVRPIRARWMQRNEEEQTDAAKKNIARITDAFDAAAAYIAARKADPAVPTDVRWEAMRPALSGASPVFIRAQELEQIQSAVSWAAARGLKVVLIGGRDAGKCLDLLKRHDVAVILTGTHRLPARDDSPYDEPYTLPGVLHQAGLRWCLATGGGGFQAPHERNLPYNAAMAVAFGLDHDVALRSITLSAAEVLGVADRLGSLDVGKSATLIVTDGDPMEITTKVEMAFIDGRKIDLRNKQTGLAEKYREKYRQIGATPSQAGR